MRITSETTVEEVKSRTMTVLNELVDNSLVDQIRNILVDEEDKDVNVNIDDMIEKLVAVRILIKRKYHLELTAQELLNFIGRALSYDDYIELRCENLQPLEVLEIFLRDTPLDDINRLFELYLIRDAYVQGGEPVCGGNSFQQMLLTRYSKMVVPKEK